MYRYKNVLSFENRKCLTNALIQNHFDYNVSAWYTNLSKNLEQKLQIAQNKMALIGQSELDQLKILNTG